MGIDVSICVSSPPVYSYLIYCLSPSYFPHLPPSTLVKHSICAHASVSFPRRFSSLYSPPLTVMFPSPSFTPITLSLPVPQLSSALMFDAVHVVVGAVRELNRSQEIGVKPLSCTSPQIWQHGTSLMNYLRMVNA